MTVTRAQFNVIIASDVDTIVQLMDQCFQIVCILKNCSNFYTCRLMTRVV